MGSDDQDKRQARSTLIAIVVVLVLAIAATVFMLPLLGEMTDGVFSEGLGAEFIKFSRTCSYNFVA